MLLAASQGPVWGWRSGAVVGALAAGVAPFAGYLSDRFGSRWLAVMGMAILSAGVFNMSRLGVDVPASSVFWWLFLVGLGSGLFQTPNNSTIMGSVPRERLGVAGGTLAGMRNTGMVLGIAVSGAVCTARAGVRLEASGAVPEPFLAGMHAVMTVGAGVVVLGTLASLAARRAPSEGRRAAARERPAPAGDSR